MSDVNSFLTIKKYVSHLPHCNIGHDWYEVFEALSYTPEGPDKDYALGEIEAKRKICTCGLNEALANIEKMVINYSEIIKLIKNL